MNKKDHTQSMADQGHHHYENIESDFVGLDDEALQSVFGGCAPTTSNTTCVPPGQSCP